MKRIVGKGKKREPPPGLDVQSGKLNSMIDELDKKIAREDKLLRQYKVQMKGASPAGKAAMKKKMLPILRRKKQWEAEREKLAGQGFNLDQQHLNLTGMQTTLETVKAMKQTKKVMKKQIKKINVDKVETLKDDIDDIMEDFNEVQDVLGQNYGMDDIDEADLDAELDMLDEFDADFDELGEEDAQPDYLMDLPGTALPAAPDGIELPAPAKTQPSNATATEV